LILRICVASDRPAVLDFWLCDFCFNRGRRLRPGRFRKLLWSSNDERVTLHPSQPAGFRGSVYIDVLLPFKFEPLNWPAGIPIHHIDVGTVIVNGIVLVSDVRHVHGLVDVSDIFRNRNDSGAEDRLTYVADIAEVVVAWSNVEFDVHVSADRLSLINNPRTARR
jgi:hypothetical protein